MEKYKNYGGNSNVYGYEIGIDCIDVWFKGGSRYTYTFQSAGRDNVEMMKKLAREGRGLNSYIMRCVRFGYAKKW